MSRKKIVAAIILLGVVLALLVAFYPTREREIKSVLLQNGGFFDPESLKLRHVRTLQDDDIFGSYCGEYMAKNRLGGYTGWHRFAAVRFEDTYTITLETMSPEFFAKMWETLECGR